MIKPYDGRSPVLHKASFIAESADIIGNVEVQKDVSIWYGAVLRGDLNSIRIGENTNVQDGVVIHCDEDAPVNIGNNVTIGHNAIIHGACIKDSCIIGMGAIVLNNAVIGENCIIGAGAIVTGGREIPSGSLVLGAPGKVIRELKKEEIDDIKKSSEHYLRLAIKNSAE